MVNLPLVKPLLSSTDIKPEKSEAQVRCEAQGGTWDEANQRCILPETEPEEVERPEPKEDPRAIEVFRDQDTGRLSGITAGGTTVLGLKPREVSRMAELQARKRELPIGGAAEASIARAQERQLRQGSELAGEVGSGDPLQQLQADFTAGELDYARAAMSAVPGIIPDILTGATTFAGAALVAGQLGPQVATPEEVITVPAAAVIGGVANAIRGFYSDFVSDLESQQREIIETPIRTLTETKSIMNDIISSQNANPAEAARNLAQFNSQLALIDREHERLKQESQSDLAKFLGENGINQLQEYEVYYIVGGERDQQIREMQLALANPDPANIRIGGGQIEELRKEIEKSVKAMQNE